MSDQTTLVRALCDPARYDHDADTVQLIETHISWVLLSGAYAYKIKKAVNLGFLDFSTLEKRRFFCAEELRLNRRLAPRLYLDVIPINGTFAEPRLNGAGPAIEYAVKMQRFPQEALLDRMLADGKFTPAQADAVAREVARFHAAIAAAPTPQGLGTPETVHQPVRENFAQIAERSSGFPENLALDPLRQWSEEEFTRRRADFAARREHGFVRECHGDLHLGNMAWIDDSPTLFDCIEFNPALRWIDVMSDAAFVVMDLHDRGHPDLAQRFLNTYLEHTGDFGGLRLLPYYQCYRAMVRAKVSCIRAGQSGLSTQQLQAAWQQTAAYLHLAALFTRPARPWLLITHGYSGSGKTTATQLLLEQTGAIRLRSDVERKRLFGLAAEARSQSGVSQGLYTPDAHIRTYRHLEQLAREILQAGFPAIVDAAFLKRAERDAFRALALELGMPFVILEMLATEDELRQRIVQREHLGHDASEATLQVLESQLRGGENIAPEEKHWTVTVNSGQPMEASLLRLAQGLMN
ncbi:MAG: AAA family ATPase, partial [Sulfurimicrobium sp.]|nr:AAA family ATPase [Sulfurimicrobium sp.]